MFKLIWPFVLRTVYETDVEYWKGEANAYYIKSLQQQSTIAQLQADLKKAQRNDMPRDPKTKKFISREEARKRGII